MLRFIWNSWWRNKERFILLIIGALIVSIGLSYLVGITQASNATIVDELQKRWKSSYHIVVRPPDSRSVTEEKNLLEPNYLSGLSGGITLEQYEKIKGMTDVDVAAPIAMMGYIRNSINLDRVQFTEPGIYRMKIKETTNTGVSSVVDESNIYFTVGWGAPNDAREYGVTHFNGAVDYGTYVLVAGVDPKAEAELVGLDEAIVEGENSHYFTDENSVKTEEVIKNIQETQIPVIVSNKEFVDGKMNYTFEKLDIPFEKDPSGTMEKVKEKGGKSYLDKQSGTQVDQVVSTTEQAHKKIVNQVSEGNSSLQDFYWMSFKPSSVNYREVTSPFPERWPFSYEVEPYFVPEDSLLAVDNAYRPISMFSEDSSGWPRLQLNFKGIFDPSDLDISKDPLTELPMETYFPSKAQWVLDKDGNPVNPPEDMKPLNNPYGFLTKPPLMLTTIEAASEVLGDKPISAIRLKVKGVEQLNEESEQTLQAVAKDIEDTTGLITDITLGSSPQPALTHIPGVNEQKSIGWIEQPWIKLGSSVTIFQESKVGMSGVIASVIVVAIVYVFSSNIIMMYARKKEFAVLLSVGWRPNNLAKLLFIEAALVGLFVSMISWLILGLIYVIHDIQTSALRLFLIGIFGITIYVLGALIPALLVRRISPYESMKTGEVSKLKRHLFKTKTLFSMSLKNLLAKYKRSVLSVIAIALPTSLLIFFLFVTFKLRGTMFTTWLGEYVALEVGPMHYVAMGVAIAIAILTTAEIIWQNVAERQPELAVLKAVGWQNRTVRLLVLIEGGLSGLIAGVLGIVIALGVIWGMYNQFPAEQLPFFLVTILIPIVTGILGAVLPARKAGNIQPYQGLTGGFVNTKRTEKSFQYVFGAVSICLFIGIIALLTQAIPDVQETNANKPSGTAKTEGTSGEVKEVYSHRIDSEKEPEDQDVGVDRDNPYETIIDTKYKNKEEDEIISLGETFNDELLGTKLTYNLVNDTPDGLETKKPNTKLITIKTKIRLEVAEGRKKGSLVQYQPQVGGFYLLDKEGNKYERIDFRKVDAKNWNKIYLETPGMMTSLLTYEVPKDIESLILVDNQSWFPLFPGGLVVDITGNVIDSASQNEGETEKLSEKSNSEEKSLFESKLDEDPVILSLGETWGKNPGGQENIFTFNIVPDKPEEVKPEKKNTELITISAELIMKGKEGLGEQYQPNVGGMYLLDKDGNKYERIHYELVEAKNWNGIELTNPGRMKSLLTYEVPKDLEALIMVEWYTWIASRTNEIVVVVKGYVKEMTEKIQSGF
ncbi:ABC transporter permease [Virgibacillus doumboii]|uniref:ABC transporter permease n=1 Tax=Virgibacillus doumboii TaxID=2697503 RepID=UPI0013E0425B|nr:ABC transporter permease [Virgibacillus doumboii]